MAIWWDTPFQTQINSLKQPLGHTQRPHEMHLPAWLQQTPALHPSSCRPSTPHCRLPFQAQAFQGRRSAKQDYQELPVYQSDRRAIGAQSMRLVKFHKMLTWCYQSANVLEKRWKKCVLGPTVPCTSLHLVGGGISESHWPRIELHLIQLDEFHRPQQPAAMDGDGATGILQHGTWPSTFTSPTTTGKSPGTELRISFKHRKSHHSLATEFGEICS